MLTPRTHPGSFPKHEPSVPVARSVNNAAKVDPHHVQHLYYGNHRKAVDVEVDGQWYSGEIRAWDQADDRSWSGVITWRRVAGVLLLDRFPANRIRKAHRPA